MLQRPGFDSRTGHHSMKMHALSLLNMKLRLIVASQKTRAVVVMAVVFVLVVMMLEGNEAVVIKVITKA
eukprot:scaffold542_cov202-Alexandrium_tamarense.AAC.5